MTFRSRSLVLAVVGLGMSNPLPGQESSPILVERSTLPEVIVQPADNQKVADAIASQLRESPRLKQYMIQVTFQDGLVELSGAVADEMQRQEALRVARMVPGVVRLLDSMTTGVIMPVQAKAAEPIPAPAPSPLGNPGMQPSPMQLHGGAPFTGGMPEPVPLFQHGMAAPHDLNPPRMPPHAWPTYAPYNNVSRNAYPTQYPYQSWPFIGPFYPFPKVPLGWRSVKLTWEDGHWWYQRCATQHDYWRIRYW